MPVSLAAVWPHGDPAAVIRSVLADRRFHTAAQRPGEKSWLDYVRFGLKRFWDWITQPFHHLTGGHTVATVLGIVVLVIVGVLLVAAIVYFARGAFGVRRVRAPSADVTLLGERDARTLFDAALAAAEAGRYRDAAVLLWSSALHALDECGRVRYDPARSPGEWRRAVQDPSFDVLARDAVIALFAERGVDAATIARMRAAYDGVLGRA